MPDEVIRTLSPEIASAQVEIVLKYDGLAVDDGTMPIEDVISALRGFSNAYGRLASAQDPTGQHQIRVAAINRSSFAVAILAWASQHPGILAATAPIATALMTLIIKLIELKKSTKGQPPISVQVDGNNNTVIITTAGDNTKIIVPRAVYELYQSKALDGDLGKMVAPLHEGKVDALSISAKDQTSTLEPVVITSSEKPFFRSDEVKTETSKPVELKGQFVSLNKESNRGRFRMENGTPVQYHFTGDNPAGMHADFAHKGPVTIECIATFDGNLELKGINITRVTRLQGDLFR